MYVPVWLLLILASLAIIGAIVLVTGLFLIIGLLRSEREDRKLHKKQKQAEEQLYQGLKEAMLANWTIAEGVND